MLNNKIIISSLLLSILPSIVTTFLIGSFIFAVVWLVFGMLSCFIPVFQIELEAYT